jgi:dolichol-phosphate mannosyltransferase
MNPIVLMPTYNEKAAIKSILDQLGNINVLVIDDNSPDGTADYVNSLNYGNVDILRRKEKDGLGNAYKAAIKKVLSENTYTHLISMDADGSHRPVDLERMLR